MGRWNGYNADDFIKVIEKYERIDEYRRKIKKADENGCQNCSLSQNDEDRIGDEEQLNFDKVEKRVNTVAGGSTGTIRNLRIREDTAKYLLNLDLDSAYYDPKSRSMREDPKPDVPHHEKCYAGDNLIKTSGTDFLEFMEIQLNHLKASEKGIEIMANVEHSQEEAVYRDYKALTEKILLNKKVDVIHKYSIIRGLLKQPEFYKENKKTRKQNPITMAY